MMEIRGGYAVIKFHSASDIQRGRFSLLFTSILPSVYNELLYFLLIIKLVIAFIISALLVMI